MIHTHVRLLVGQPVIYSSFPDRVCIINQIHDKFVPVHYDVAIPISNGSEEMRDQYLYARGIRAEQLRVVDTLIL